MELTVLRYNSESDYTDVLLFIDDNFDCYTLEDNYRSVKVFGKTRIPDGKYKLELRTVGGFHNRYLKRYGNKFHKGMLWITDVPNFKYILIHIGNDDDDTDGCILVGSYLRLNRVLNSRSTYRSIYPGIVSNIKKRKTYLEIIDYDSPPPERII